MSKFSLDAEMEFEVKARFITKGNDEPLTGDEYKVHLFDRSLFTGDNYIGESVLDANGTARFSFPASVYENAPDLGFGPEFYLIVFKKDVEIFKSKVIRNFDPAIVEQYKKGEGEVLDFGTYLVTN